jgi:hypothetical protein
MYVIFVLVVALFTPLSRPAALPILWKESGGFGNQMASLSATLQLAAWAAEERVAQGRDGGSGDGNDVFVWAPPRKGSTASLAVLSIPQGPVWRDVVLTTELELLDRGINGTTVPPLPINLFNRDAALALYVLPELGGTWTVLGMRRPRRGQLAADGFPLWAAAWCVRDNHYYATRPSEVPSILRALVTPSPDVLELMNSITLPRDTIGLQVRIAVPRATSPPEHRAMARLVCQCVPPNATSVFVASLHPAAISYVRHRLEPRGVRVHSLPPQVAESTLSPHVTSAVADVLLLASLPTLLIRSPASSFGLIAGILSQAPTVLVASGASFALKSGESSSSLYTRRAADCAVQQVCADLGGGEDDPACGADLSPSLSPHR